MAGTKLFVGNVPNGTSKEELTRVFAKYGEVIEVTIVKNFGFIHMTSEQEANHAIEMLDGSEFSGNIINVEISHGGKERRPRDDVRNNNSTSRKSYNRADDSRDSHEHRYSRNRYDERQSNISNNNGNNNERGGRSHREGLHNPLEAITGRPDLPIAASMLAATLLNPSTLSMLQNLANLRNIGNRGEDIGRSSRNREERRYSRRSPQRNEKYSSSSSSRYQPYERRRRSRSNRDHRDRDRSSQDRGYSRRH